MLNLSKNGLSAWHMDVSQELMDGMQLNLHSIGKGQIVHSDMHNISRSHEVMNQNCHHGLVWVVVGRGFLFSLKRLMYFHCYFTLLDR